MKQIPNVLSIFVLLASMGAHASVEVVTCSAQVDNKIEKISVKVSDKGLIEFWEKNKMAEVGGDSNWLGVFSEDIEDYGFDFTRSEKNAAGNMTLEAGDTAGAFEFNLKSNRKSAVFKYTDKGSGAGNKEFKLSCESAAVVGKEGTPIVTCNLPVNRDLGIDKKIPVSLLKDGARQFKARVGQPPVEFGGLTKISVKDAQAIALTVGYFREALYVVDSSKITSADLYTSAEGSEREVKIFKFLDDNGSLVTWAALVDGIGSGCN